MLNNLKRKFDEEKRESEELHQMMMQDIDANEPLNDVELEELLNNDE